MSAPSGSSSGDFSAQTAPLFAASVQIGVRQRSVSVRYMNIQETIAQISGSWAISLSAGLLAVLASQHMCGGPFLSTALEHPTVVHQLATKPATKITL